MSLYKFSLVYFILFSTISYSATVTEELQMIREEMNEMHDTIQEELNASSQINYDVEHGMNQGIDTITGFLAFIFMSMILIARHYLKNFTKHQINLLKEFAIRSQNPKATDKEVYEKMKVLKIGK